MLKARSASRNDLTIPAQIDIVRVGNGVYSTALGGFFVSQDADRLIAQLEPLMAGSRPHFFFDTERLTGYRPEFREGMTEWYGRRKEDFGSFNVLVRSKVVSMAIAVANLATRGEIRTFSDRPSYEKAKHDAIGGARGTC